MKVGLARLLSVSTKRVLELEALQSSVVEEHADLNLGTNSRSSSLVLLRASVFTLLNFTMVLVIDGLMCLNVLKGHSQNCFVLAVELVEVVLEAWVLLEWLSSLIIMLFSTTSITSSL